MKDTLYTAAVNGRRHFREAYKKSLIKCRELETQLHTLEERLAVAEKLLTKTLEINSLPKDNESAPSLWLEHVLQILAFLASQPTDFVVVKRKDLETLLSLSHLKDVILYDQAADSDRRDYTEARDRLEAALEKEPK